MINLRFRHNAIYRESKKKTVFNPNFKDHTISTITKVTFWEAPTSRKLIRIPLKNKSLNVSVLEEEYQILGYISHRDVESIFLSPRICAGPVTPFDQYYMTEVTLNSSKALGASAKFLGMLMHASRTPSHLERCCRMKCHAERGQDDKVARLQICEWRSILTNGVPAPVARIDAIRIRHRLPGWVLPPVLNPKPQSK